MTDSKAAREDRAQKGAMAFRGGDFLGLGIKPPVAMKRRRWGAVKAGKLVALYLDTRTNEQLQDMARDNQMSKSLVVETLIKAVVASGWRFEVLQMPAEDGSVQVSIIDPRQRV